MIFKLLKQEGDVGEDEISEKNLGSMPAEILRRKSDVVTAIVTYKDYSFI